MARSGRRERESKREKGEDMNEERNEGGVNGGEREQSFGLGVDLC